MVYSSTKINLISQRKSREYSDTNSNKSKEIQSTNIFTFHDSTSSGVNFELGIGYNLILMFVNKYNSQDKVVENSIKPSPLDIVFSVGLRFHQRYDINFRFGFDEIDEDFGGFNGGLFFESSLFGSNIYGTFGIDFYNNFGNSHNTSESGGNLIFYCLGVEYRANTNFTWNLIYWVPNKKVFGTDIVFKDNKFIYYDKINHGLLRIGLQYSFIF
ncbi:hypothetical protein BMS3Abin04_00714 [bacterium BMS3Abin04]|nr:hypothetical protein BMS3Abin04_00714 [bacterium BMS3Abin04]